MAETDLWFGTLSATVRVEDLPASRQVVAIERQANGDWRVCGQAVSNAEGIATLPITGLPTSRIYAIAIDEWGKPFAPGMPVAYGDVIRPTQFLGWMYQVTSPGVLPGTEPEWWNSMAGVPQPVGTAMMQAVRHYQPVAHGPVSDIEWEEQGFDPYWDNVVALLHFDVGLEDEAGGVWTGSAVVEGGKLNTAPGIIQRGAATRLVPATGDFTIEAAIVFESGGRYGGFIFSHDPNSSGFRGPNLIVMPDKALYFGVEGAVALESSAGLIPVGVETHVAVVRQGPNFRMYVDGQLSASATFSGSLGETQSALPTIGRISTAPPDTRYIGLIDEFRITSGIARYTENFDPPTAPFPNVGPPL